MTRHDRVLILQDIGPDVMFPVAKITFKGHSGTMLEIIHYFLLVFHSNYVVVSSKFFRYHLYLTR